MMPTTGEIISELREDKKLTQKELAELIGVARNTISKYEVNEFLPDSANLIALSKFFDVSVDYLLGLSRSSISTRFIDNEYIKLDNNSLFVGNIIKDMLKLSKESKYSLVDYMRYLLDRENKEKAKK